MNNTAAWSRRIPFKVDIAGIIEIMGTSLYSRATTPVRELIQNANDAIVRRRQQDLSFKGRIDVTQDSVAGTLTFSDDGIGLTADEAERYLGTLGVGITGILKRGTGGDDGPAGDARGLIGMFGIGLFSAFMLADRLVVETRHANGAPAVRWEAGAGTDIVLSSSARELPGTSVMLFLKESTRGLASDVRAIEEAIKEYADFLPVPIHLNGGDARINVIHASWLDPTPDAAAIATELESTFHETPLEVIPVRWEGEGAVRGALYITPQRTPGFSGESRVTATVRRMVISRSIEGLVPEWAGMVRGVVELSGCSPTASREDLVRDDAFDAARDRVEKSLYAHLERLAKDDRPRLESLVTWHRYTLAGGALTCDRLRKLLRGAYGFPTSHGVLTFDDILSRSDADALIETEAEKVIWCNVERHQENWANNIFGDRGVPCVHALRSFEESLLAALVADARQAGVAADLRPVSAGTQGFAESILGVHDMEEAGAEWQELLACTGAKVFVAGFSEKTPVLAFLNERRELQQTFEELKKRDALPPGFQRVVERHFADLKPGQNEVVLNRRHGVVGRALKETTRHPLASVVRMLALSALTAAGAGMSAESRRAQADDLDWIADALATRSKMK